MPSRLPFQLVFLGLHFVSPTFLDSLLPDFLIPSKASGDALSPRDLWPGHQAEHSDDNVDSPGPGRPFLG